MRNYIQSAYHMKTEEKVIQEKTSLRYTDDPFKKIIIVGEECPFTRDKQGNRYYEHL